MDKCRSRRITRTGKLQPKICVNSHDNVIIKQLHLVSAFCGTKIEKLEMALPVTRMKVIWTMNLRQRKSVVKKFKPSWRYLLGMHFNNIS